MHSSKSLWLEIFFSLIIFKVSPKMHLFDQKYNKICNIAKYYYKFNQLF